MGQYYKPINLDTREWLSPWDYDQGAKLMEHSWLKNRYVQTIEHLLATSWQNCHFSWSGDYADPPTSDGQNRYMTCEDQNKIQPPVNQTYYQYILNHSKKEFVNKNLCPPDNDGWIVHPLPLLTCEGNGRGGGDFRTKNEYIGRWCGDSISASNTLPLDYTEIHPGFIE